MSVYVKENPQYLDEAICSIYDNQTLKPEQIVLVKDGTLTEELDKCISNWKQKLNKVLTVVELHENIGLGAALNEGLKYCKYELVARMDSDDISLPNRFEKQIAFIKENPEIAIISGYISEFINNIDDVISIRKVPLTHDEIKKRLKWRNAFNHMTVMFKKDIVMSLGGYNQKIIFFEDYDLWIRMMQAGCIAANLPEVLVNARIGNNMIGRRHGLSYVKREMYFFTLQKERKFINVFEYFILVILRIPPRLIPASILVCFYKLLRSK